MSASTVTFTARCPDCGTDATWYGTKTTTGQATDTAYEIDCLRCDETWSIQRQIARHLERQASRRAA